MRHAGNSRSGRGVDARMLRVMLFVNSGIALALLAPARWMQLSDGFRAMRLMGKIQGG